MIKAPGFAAVPEGLERQKARHPGWRAFWGPNNPPLRRARSRRRRRKGVGGTAVAALVRNDDGNGSNDPHGGGADNQSTIADILRGFYAGGLTRGQRAIRGESRRTNHRCHRKRGNNILKTVHRLPPLSDAGYL